MKYTIMGFSQARLLEYELDLTDALILRWFLDFKATDKMVAETYEGKTYYWINYGFLMNDVPIIGVSNKDALRRRLKKMEDKGILIHMALRKDGVYSFYGLGENLHLLLDYSALEFDTPTQKSEGYDSKVGRGTTQKSEQKINLLKDKTTKDNFDYKSVIDYLNKKTGKNYKTVETNNKHIRARYKEGYTLEDFYRVIDFKVLQWKGTEWEQYLRPTTLFGTKFEIYLNNSPERNIDLSKEVEKDEKFKNFLDTFKGVFDDE